jgi:Domain of unknown function (DUF4905)
LIKIFNYNFGGKIWNTAFSEKYCVLEIRDESTRQVSFSCVNLTTGNLLWQNMRPEKSWWLSLVGIFDDFLILHKFSSNQKPEPQGLLVIRVETGEVLDQINDWIFFNYTESVLIVYQLQNSEPIYKSIDLNRLVPTIQQSEGHPSHHVIISIPTVETSPTHYPEDSPHFPTIYKFLYRLLNIDAVKAVDYLEMSNKIIISYYIYRDKSFLNYLLVTNRSRQILLNELIAETEGIGIDTFTVKSDTLLYVKNQTQFVGYKL